MPQRLNEQYQPGDQVEIHLAHAGWQPGRIMGFQPPGAWIQTGDGGLWFVTNTRRIRPYQPDAG